MYSFTFRNASEATVGLSRAIANHGLYVGNTRELTNVAFEIQEPMERHLYVRNRLNNPIAAIVESLWVLWGKNEISYIEPYLPRAGNFSDDGKTWRAGYGPRIRDFHGVDQVKEIVEILREDLESRRAVITIYDPSEDSNQVKTLDTPCNNWLAFRVRSGKLEMSISVRSNDLIWGLSGINMFEWSCLQQFVAESLGVPVGPQVWLDGSLHVYEPYFHHLDDDSRKFSLLYEDEPVQLLQPLGVDMEGTALTEWFELIRQYESGDYSTDFSQEGTYLRIYADFVKLYWIIKNKDSDDPSKLVRQILGNLPPHCDLLRCMDNYFTRLLIKDNTNA